MSFWNFTRGRISHWGLDGAANAIFERSEFRHTEVPVDSWHFLSHALAIGMHLRIIEQQNSKKASIEASQLHSFRRSFPRFGTRKKRGQILHHVASLHIRMYYFQFWIQFYSHSLHIILFKNSLEMRDTDGPHWKNVRNSYWANVQRCHKSILNTYLHSFVPHLLLPFKCDRNRSVFHTFEAQSTKLRLKAERNRFGSLGAIGGAMSPEDAAITHSSPPFPRCRCKTRECTMPVWYGFVGNWSPGGRPSALWTRVSHFWMSHTVEFCLTLGMGDYRHNHHGRVHSHILVKFH